MRSISTVLLVALVAGTSSGVSGGSEIALAGEIRCPSGATDGMRVVHRKHGVLLYRPIKHPGALYGCHQKVGKLYALADDRWGETASAYKVAGRYVATVEVSLDADGELGRRVAATDLTTGFAWYLYEYNDPNRIDAGDGEGQPALFPYADPRTGVEVFEPRGRCIEVTDFVQSAQGWTGWIAHDSCRRRGYYQVNTQDGTVELGRTIAPRSLRLSHDRRRIVWRRDGLLRSALIAKPTVDPNKVVPSCEFPRSETVLREGRARVLRMPIRNRGDYSVAPFGCLEGTGRARALERSFHAVDIEGDFLAYAWFYSGESNGTFSFNRVLNLRTGEHAALQDSSDECRMSSIALSRINAVGTFAWLSSCGYKGHMLFVARFDEKEPRVLAREEIEHGSVTLSADGCTLAWTGSGAQRTAPIYCGR